MVKDSPTNAGDTRDVVSILGLGGSPGRRKWQPTSVFLPGKFYRQRSLVGYNGVAKNQTQLSMCMHTHTLYPSYVLKNSDLYLNENVQKKENTQIKLFIIKFSVKKYEILRV